VRSLVLAACAAAVLSVAPSAQAHRTGAHSGLISTVSYVDPLVPGLLVRVLDGHVRLSVANLTKQDVYILDGRGRRVQHVPAGRTRVWREARVGANETKPEREGLIRYWRVPGKVGEKRFQIIGFLGYRTPGGAAASDDGMPRWLIILGALGGAALLAGALAFPLVVRRSEA
jgi:hypothetical protein